jgi:hypothetical protein
LQHVAKLKIPYILSIISTSTQSSALIHSNLQIHRDGLEFFQRFLLVDVISRETCRVGGAKFYHFFSPDIHRRKIQSEKTGVLMIVLMTV